jgi:hypothetical protein
VLITMKVQAVLLALVCLFVASNAQFAYVRFVNGFDGAPSVNIFANNVLQIGSPYFLGSASSYGSFLAGINSFAITNPTTLAVLATLSNFPLSSGAFYTIYASGTTTATLQIVSDNPLVGLTTTTIRGVNLVSGLVVKLVADAQTAAPQTITAANLGTGVASPYQIGTIALPTTVTFVNALLANSQVTAPASVPLLPNHAYSVILVNTALPRVIVTDDSEAGIPNTPLGAISIPNSIPNSIPRSFPGFVKRRKN